MDWSRGTHNQSLKRLYTNSGEVWGRANFPPCKEIDIERIAKKLDILFLTLKLLWTFWSQKWTQTHYQCLEYAITTHFKTYVSYFVKYCQSHETLIWICIMLWISFQWNYFKERVLGGPDSQPPNGHYLVHACPDAIIESLLTSEHL